MNVTGQNQCPRLIEVALPIREISAESVRQTSPQRGNIATLHIWWARRPQAASRAVVFASLIPDPDDARCPRPFRDAVEMYLRTNVPSELQYYRRGRRVIRDEDPYCPYPGISDSLRARLLMFIAKWSKEYFEFDAGRSLREPATTLLLDDRSLVKLETTDPNNPQGRRVIQIARDLVRAAFDGREPTVLDPFSGGGGIPLEATRLGCATIANDYNPVAHVILRATCEYPQRFGLTGRRKIVVNELGHQSELDVTVENVLTHDVGRWASFILARASSKLQHLYPPGEDGLPVVAYIWARTIPCTNPSCRAEIPVLRSLLLRGKDEQAALVLNCDFDRKTIDFGIAYGSQIRSTAGTKAQRGPLMCPCCKETTSESDLRRIAVEGKMRERPVAVVIEREGAKRYRPVEEADLRAIEASKGYDVEVPSEFIVPEVNAPTASARAGSHRSINLELYGFTRWGQLFNRRQLVVLHELIDGLREAVDQMKGELPDPDYRRAVATYLAFWIDRIAVFTNTMSRWHPVDEGVKPPFSGQSIPMMWDYPEVNPFSGWSGSAESQLDYILRVVSRESAGADGRPAAQVLLGSATDLGLESSVDCVVTDPPYGNSIAYADLSDFFYVWLKRSIGDLYPEVFLTPQTPKTKEATSHKHRHEGSQQRADTFYRELLAESFAQCRRAMREPHLMSVMFAHQSSEAWTALLSALFDAGLCPDATWPIATEKPTGALGLGTASLETSVTVVCRPRVVGAAESFKNVKREIERVVQESVKRFWSYGFRGADLIVACYGPAVGVFGKYEHVEKGDGTPVGVPELLELARRAALEAIAGEFRGDNLSTMYYVWANLYGSSEQAWDDARLVVQIGGNAESAMEVARGQGIFVVDASKVRLALLDDRKGRKGLGTDPNSPLIDSLHRAMLLWKEERRADLVSYLTAHAFLDEEAVLWKLAQALFEVLPRDSEDWKLVSALLSERQNLKMEAKRSTAQTAQQQLFAEEQQS